MSEGYTWAIPTWHRPEERSRIIYLCPLCKSWQLDAGSHESRPVLEALIAEHALEAHSITNAAGFYAAVVEANARRAEEEYRERTAPFLDLDYRLAAWADAVFAVTAPHEGAARRVVELHRLDPDYRYSPSCRSCGLDAGEDPIEWPCQTAAVFLEAAGLTLTTTEGSERDRTD